ncbi:MAG: carbohydrate-binding domain-containing protein [Muribaculaceae bacterium]|nr:carbohydrate-binding domain-containing protein [Muribaculaceae bacterium]
MKNQILTFLLALACASVLYSQQTMWVSTGQVKYSFDTQQVGRMPFNVAGDTLTVLGKAFAISDVDSIYLTNTQTEGNTVMVNYDDTVAWVTIAGNIATQVTPIVDGANVRMVQDSTMQQEVFYTLSGTSSNGSFYQEGEYKATFILNGLTLTSSAGPAIDINDGKRIEIQLVDGTTTTLADGAKGTHKAAFNVEGHSEFKGGGNLVITGNTKHGFKSDEYMELKKSFTGLINVKNAVGDGLSINQYLEVKSGRILVERCEGDGIQVDAKADSTKVKNGQFIMSGGSISIEGVGEDCKGIKVEKAVTISDGVIEVVAEDNALHSKTNMIITGGNIYTYSIYAHGVNAGDSLTIAGGKIVAFAAPTVGYGVRGATALFITGGDVAAIGALVSTPKTVEESQPVLTYQGTVYKTIMSLTDETGNAVMTFDQSRSYSSSKRHTLLLSSPSLIEDADYTLNKDASLNDDAENWHGLYASPEAVIDAGTEMATGTAMVPYGVMQ